MTDVIRLKTMKTITPIGDNLEVGTRIHWDESTQSLYYVDLPQSTIYKYKPSSGVITKAKVGTEPLAFAFPVDDQPNRFIAGLGRKIVILRWDGVSNSTCACNILVEVDRHSHHSTIAPNRLNGAKIDPYGRLWAGTMGPKDENGDIMPGRGSLYSLTNGVLKRHLSDVGISNGLAFDTNLNKMYYIDTLFPGIYEFDYDGENGEISNKEVLFEFEHHNISGLPDGMTTDSHGNLWVTVIYGSAILKIDPKTKTLLKKIEMPTSQITSLTFGNKDLNVLYVTTARMEVDGKVPGEPAGCTFKIGYFRKNKAVPDYRYKM